MENDDDGPVWTTDGLEFGNLEVDSPATRPDRLRLGMGGGPMSPAPCLLAIPTAGTTRTEDEDKDVPSDMNCTAPEGDRVG